MNRSEMVGGIILFVITISLLRGCVSTGFQYNYNSCMQGTITPLKPFKALFVCLWVGSDEN